MNDLRSLFPTQIVRGALLRPDRVAVGLVSGGAPAWDLLSLAARSQAGDDYHRLLLALDAPIDVYVVDQPPDIASAVATLVDRQARVEYPLQADVLAAMADYLSELGQFSTSRSKQTIWAITSSAATTTRVVGEFALARLVGRERHQSTGQMGASRTVLAQAIEQARRLADMLTTLGATPAPRLMEAEEIAQLLYRLADPVRSQRYPLAGMLLDRVRRIVSTENHDGRSPV